MSRKFINQNLIRDSSNSTPFPYEESSYTEASTQSTTPQRPKSRNNTSQQQRPVYRSTIFKHPEYTEAKKIILQDQQQQAIYGQDMNNQATQAYPSTQSVSQSFEGLNSNQCFNQVSPCKLRWQASETPELLPYTILEETPSYGRLETEITGEPYLKVEVKKKQSDFMNKSSFDFHKHSDIMDRLPSRQGIKISQRPGTRGRRGLGELGDIRENNPGRILPILKSKINDRNNTISPGQRNLVKSPEMIVQNFKMRAIQFQKSGNPQGEYVFRRGRMKSKYQ